MVNVVIYKSYETPKILVGYDFNKFREILPLLAYFFMLKEKLKICGSGVSMCMNVYYALVALKSNNAL
jgi:hypothetical protein